MVGCTYNWWRGTGALGFGYNGRVEGCDDRNVEEGRRGAWEGGIGQRRGVNRESVNEVEDILARARERKERLRGAAVLSMSVRRDSAVVVRHEGRETVEMGNGV